MTQYQNTKERLVVFDFIRLFAILMVVFSHTFVVGDLPFDIKNIGILGNVLFFFISGYLIYINNSSITSKKDIFIFYKKRLLRIYPLYILAVFVSICLLGNGNYSPFEIIVSFFGLQMVFYPTYINSLLLWFIGMILIFYLIYPIVIYFSQKKVMRYLILSCVAIGILALIKISTGLIGGAVFEYYFVFVAGVFCGLTNIFKSKFIHPISIISFILLLGSIVLIQFLPSIKAAEYLTLSPEILLVTGSVILLRIVYGISAFFVLYTLYNLYDPSNIGSKIITYGAFAAYAVYLFHGPYFTIINTVVLSSEIAQTIIFDNVFIYYSLLIFLFIPLIFIISYYIQKGENICITWIQKRWGTVHNYEIK